MLVRRIFFSIAVAAFAAAGVSNGLDRISRNLPGLERLVPPPFRAQADRSAAATALDRQNDDAALARARDAVSTDPVDPDATALLGSALMRVGRADDGERAFRVAAQFGWRNVETQAFWYDVALHLGNYELAADRIDALLRVHARLIEQPELLKPMESAPAAEKALAERLQSRPPWLDDYLKVGDDTPSGVINRRLSVLSKVNVTRFPLGCGTIAPFVRVLLDTGRRRDAESLWNGNCPTSRVTGLIADPTFSQVVNPNLTNPFSWRIMSSGDLSVDEIASGNNRGLALANSASGTRLTLVQTVAFPAGLYRFRVKQLDGSSSTTGKFFLSWACNQPPPFPDPSGGDLLGTGQIVRIDECDRQQIGLWLSGGGASVRLQSIAFEKIG